MSAPTQWFGLPRVGGIAWGALLAAALASAWGWTPQDTLADAAAGQAVAPEGDKRSYGVFEDLALPAPAPDGRIEVLPNAGRLECAECHSAVTAEWSRSAHGLAWVDELYQAEIQDRRKPESCHGCHVPEPVHHKGDSGELEVELKPAPRTALSTTDEVRHAPGAWHFGVDCNSCHLAPDGALLGPRGTVTDAHRSRRANSLLGPEASGAAGLLETGSNALCASCHSTHVGPVLGVAKDFVKAGVAAQGASCVGCHMARVEQAFANLPNAAASDEALPPPVRQGRSHALQTPRDPAFLRRAFELRLIAADGATTVEIDNATGHRVPGLIERRIEFRALALNSAEDDSEARADPALEEVPEAPWVTVAIDARRHLKAGQSLRMDIESGTERVLVRGLHFDPRLEAPQLFLEQVLTLP